MLTPTIVQSAKGGTRDSRTVNGRVPFPPHLKGISRHILVHRPVLRRHIPGKKSPVYEDFDGKLARLFATKPSLFWIGIGKDDFLYQANSDFRKKLDDAGYDYSYVESDGGHIWRNWRIYLSRFVPLLFQ